MVVLHVNDAVPEADPDALTDAAPTQQYGLWPLPVFSTWPGQQ